MPRDPKPPRLWYRKARKARKGRSAEKGVWVVLANGLQISTGCGKGETAGAEKFLSDYIVSRHKAPRRQRGIDEIPLSDVLVIYLDDVVPKLATKKKAEGRIDRLNEWWGDFHLSEVTGAKCREYISTKTDGAARRELQDLQAAINHHHREGLHREEVLVTLPPAGEPRERWLTRQEVAKLLRICLHTPEVQEGQPTDKRPLRHLARFILFALYTGSRPGDVCSASFKVAADRSVIDLDTGLFYRKPSGKRATKKRQPTIPLSQRLQAHLRRWQAKGADYVVEFDKAGVKSIKTAFYRAVGLAGLGPDVVAYTLRHTCATWMMQRATPTWQVAGYLGTSEAMIIKHYAHHHPEHQRAAAESVTQRNPNDKTRTNRQNVVQFETKKQRKSIA